jgi:YidC/Oxa1 family membrane protein insertase
MDKNSIIGIIVIAGIIIVWGILSKPSKEELERRKSALDSLRQVQQEQAEQEIIEQQKKEAEPEIVEVPVEEKEDIEVLRGRLGQFAEAGTGDNEFYTLENDLIKLTISKKGGKPYSVELKKYKTFDSLPLLLFIGDSTVFGMNFYHQNKIVSTNELYFAASTDDKSIKVTDYARNINMRLNAGEDRYIEYQYSLEPNSYAVNLDIRLVGLEDITTRDPKSIDLSWEIYSPKHEKGKKNENYYTTLYFKPYQDDVDFFNARTNKEVQEEDITTQVEWIAFKDQFFSSVIIAEKTFANALIKSTNLPESEKHLKIFSAEIGLPWRREYDETIPVKFYFGPNKFSYLKKNYSDIMLHDMVSVGRGIIKWINQFVIIKIFDWLNKSINNYGLIILLLTVIIKVALFPLTYRSFLSQAKMKVLKPQIDEITKKYPKGKEMERQKATMGLYKKAGVSPLGGCLPMLLQFPILFAMFRFFPTSIELRQESFLWAHDLSTYDSILEWSGNIPIISKLYGNHISLFTLLMTASTILTMKFSGQTTSGSQQMPGMKGMMYMMPIMFMFILNNFSAGLTYYYFLANLITFGQNLLFKQFVNDEELLKKMESRNTKVKKKSSFQSRLQEMAKKRNYKPKKR